MKVIPTAPIARPTSFSGDVPPSGEKHHGLFHKRPLTRSEIISEEVNKELRPKSILEALKQMFTIDWRSIKYK